MATARKPASKSDEKKSLAEERAVAGYSDGIDRVAVVSRYGNGEPRQSPGFRVVLHHDATDEDKAVAWNLNGELPPEDVIDYINPPQV